MRILYTDNSEHPELERELGAERVPLAHLLENADIISLHVPLTETTKGLIGAEQFSQMKPTAILVNAARGAVVNTEALVTALKSGQIGYAALDVTDPEPLPPSHPLYQQPNAIVVPHIGSATRTTREQMSLLAVDNLIAGLEGRPLPKAVVQH
jgi:glyoxylate reductase